MRAWDALLLAAIFSCLSCSTAFSPTLRAGSEPRRYEISQQLAPPQVARAFVNGSAFGIVVDGPLHLAAQLGNDAWRFADPITIGQPTSDAAAQLVWNHRFVFLMEIATGQPRVALELPSDRSRVPPSAVVMDASETRIAALYDGVLTVLWTRFDAPPRILLPSPRLPTSRFMPMVKRSSRQIEPEESALDDLGWHSIAWRGDNETRAANSAAASRLFFSKDGKRLTAGMQIYDLPEGKPLLALQEDELVVDASDSAAVVAQLAYRERLEPPGSQCGFQPRITQVRLAKLEYRMLDGSVVSYPGPLYGLPYAASASERWVSLPADAQGSRFELYDLETGALLRTPGAPRPPINADRSSAPIARTEPIESIDVANDGTLLYVEKHVAILARGGSLTPLKLPPGHAEHAHVKSVSLGPRGPFAVVRESRPRSADHDAVYAFDEAGLPRAVIFGGDAQRVSREGYAVIGSDRLALFSAVEKPDRRALSMPDYRAHETYQGRAAGSRRVVLRDPTSKRDRFLVFDGRSAPRSHTVSGEPSDQWDLSPDGSTLAATTDGGLSLLSLDDGRTIFTAPLLSRTPIPGHAPIRSITTSREVTVVGMNDGSIRVFLRGQEFRIDLRGRQDVATALAISPDERLIAVGTARGRLLLFARDQVTEGGGVEPHATGARTG